MKLFRMAAGAAALSALAGLPAFAGECPANQVISPLAFTGATMPEGVTDTVIGEIDLGTQYNVPGRNFRMRRPTIAPGGVVPLHAHDDRPAHIYVVSGEIVEHRSTCAVPIVHKMGDVAVESGKLSHWWQNEGQEPVVLISADILPPAGNPDETM
jgi:quercetin dioxygenase-like cupin family protein